MVDKMSFELPPIGSCFSPHLFMRITRMTRPATGMAEMRNQVRISTNVLLPSCRTFGA